MCLPADLVFTVVRLYSSTETTSAWKNSCFILSEGSDFNIVDKLSIAVYTLTRLMLISLSGDEIMLPRYMNSSTNLVCFLCLMAYQPL